MFTNTREYEWSDINVVVAGRNITGLRAISYTGKQEKEPLFAKGNRPHSIQRGNKSYEGSITLLQSEYEALTKAAGGDVLDISFDVVACYGNPSKGDAITTDILTGCEFTEDKTDWKQGDKFQEKAMPFIYLNQKNQAV
jgi:hypothetical protein